MRTFSIIPVLCAFAAFAGTPRDTIRSAAELAAATYDREENGREFDLQARVTAVLQQETVIDFALEDATGSAVMRSATAFKPRIRGAAGSLVRVAGRVLQALGGRRCYAQCDRLDILEPGEPPKPVPVTGDEFLSGRFDCRPVTVSGIVRDIIKDEIDASYVFIVLRCGGECITMPLIARNPVLHALAVGATIEATGVCVPSEVGARRQLGRHLQVEQNTIRILSRGDDDPFAAEEVDDSSRLRPQDIAALGRRKATGRILAVWKGAALLKTDDGRIIGLENATAAMPHCGDCVEAVGFPESNLYHINLSRAIWRKVPGNPAQDEPPVETTAEKLQTFRSGRRMFDPFIHGHAIRITGRVLNLPDEGNSGGRFNLQCGSAVVPVDVSDSPSALRGLSPGCEISVTGVCIMECENWRPNVPFPTIRGFFIAVRRPDDIAVLAYPSWWTPSRLATALGSLFILLVGSIVWNVLLKRLAEKRGRELAESAIAKAEADLKVYERTRLAVELHDSLSQYLTGISLAIRASTRLAADSPDGLRRNLDLAASSLDSCRQELRNCLWDLRNQTLDETDITAAIRQTLEPHLGDASLSIRFNVPRERFSDNSTHAILHILRELATNAVRHGHATRIRVAGSIEGDRLLFSVRDNGCGFDPDSCPGMDKGHFGLQGIRERVNQFEGEMSVVSRPAAGTRVSVSLHMPGTEKGSE